MNSLKKLRASSLPVAAVATGFPSGQYPLVTRLEEIRLAVAAGASEIDIVINRQMALEHQWLKLYEEVKLMKRACGDGVHLKTILAVGELGSMENVYKASLVCMMAGADFIKTSTGKEAVNATLAVGLVMCRYNCVGWYPMVWRNCVVGSSYCCIPEPYAIITRELDLWWASNLQAVSALPKMRASGSASLKRNSAMLG